MLRVEKKWCSECCERTNHNYVGSKSDYEGLGIARAILAVFSKSLLVIFVLISFKPCSSSILIPRLKSSKENFEKSIFKNLAILNISLSLYIFSPLNYIE